MLLAKRVCLYEKLTVRFQPTTFPPCSTTQRHKSKSASILLVVDYGVSNKHQKSLKEIFLKKKLLFFTRTHTDCAGKEDYARLRPLSYVGTDCFCVSMSVVCRSSMENLKSVWFPEIHHHQPGVPILVIGTKTDLRNDPATLEKLRQRDEQPISEEEARAFCESLGAQYIECSALTGDTHHVFLKATHMAVQFSLKQLGLLQTERFSFFERFFGKKKVPKAAQTAVVGRMDPNGNMRARNGAELLEMEQWLAATLAAGAAADSLSSCSSDE